MSVFGPTKTDDNADTWEAAIRHFNKVSVSSCFLMELDKGCLQPSVFDDSIFGKYIGSLVKNEAGSWEPACEKPMSVKTVVGCSGKVHGGICHVTMMYGSMSKSP